jgi:hypothetical protein
MGRTKTKRRLFAESERTAGNVVKIMSDGDQEVMNFLEKYIAYEPFSLQWIDVLDVYQIYGRSILVFFTKCCNGDVATFSKILLGLENYSFADSYIGQKKIVKDSIRRESGLAFQC